MSSPPDPYLESAGRDNSEENPDDYVPGGYHPIEGGERWHDNRYLVIRKLGWGQFSTVWLAHDKQLDRHVAIKVAKSGKLYTDNAKKEIEFHQRVASANSSHPGYAHVVSLLDHFTLDGPNGTHICLVVEVLGLSLAGLNALLGRLPPPMVRKIGRDLLLGLDYLHRECGIIHTDIKPANVLICIDDIEKLIRCELRDHQTIEFDRKSSCPLRILPSGAIDQTNVKICDLGSAAAAADKTSREIQTRQYRSPEVVIDAPWDRRVDIWSLGCMVSEMTKPLADHATHIGTKLLCLYSTYIIPTYDDRWNCSQDLKTFLY
ncbi:CMGC/SRPK protein kinase [Puccinia triticina 1-1 BBBD Race 1]|uniref:non-specific serine/threonine protein kinase n=2 Tax=Puccinia triticina TaxID=208348 RepID=A0A180GJY8_PUCT1|nr:uncharacterized protein PtA15_16A339 [Puccinia triticina]OAV93097.1 CMGC/SRPK protein kinase [Puccinia triticina 1-1 BBBD Race 1]WAQ92431.1 hypothetical protein PtA15_16A339 [Puccinia triticina]